MSERPIGPPIEMPPLAITDDPKDWLFNKNGKHSNAAMNRYLCCILVKIGVKDFLLKMKIYF